MKEKIVELENQLRTAKDVRDDLYYMWRSFNNSVHNLELVVMDYEDGIKNLDEANSYSMLVKVFCDKVKAII